MLGKSSEKQFGRPKMLKKCSNIFWEFAPVQKLLDLPLGPLDESRVDLRFQIIK